MTAPALRRDTTVDARYDHVIELLADDAAGVLQSATQTAAQHADTVVARLTAEVAGLVVGRDVAISVAQFEPIGITHVRVPLRWRAREQEALFPAMRAALEVRMVSLTPPRTQLAIAGCYEPPLRRLGAVLDSAVGHRLAEATVQRFVEAIAERIEELVAAAGDARPHLGQRAARR
jgi:hypothetical protein